MKYQLRLCRKCVVGFLVPIFVLLVMPWMINGFLGRGALEAKITQEPVTLDKAHPLIRAVMDIQHRHTHKLMAIPEIVGTGTGLNEAGRPAVVVFTRDEVGPGVVPESLEGTPVLKKITGEIRPMRKLPPTTTFPRPVPIGVSTGNEGECSAGTIGVRVTDGENVYALSNNHVFALENSARVGSKILQPGAFDTSCAEVPNDVIATLSQFVPLVFSTSANNIVDAAIALSSKESLGNATPRDGYGIPRSAVVEAGVGLKVKKYGRTTSLTRGTITAINATVNVGYESGAARFINQIVVQSSGSFIKPGDSGSLLVTRPGSNPVGLLFAGNATGNFAFANPIGAVLEAFGVTLDGR